MRKKPNNVHYMYLTVVKVHVWEVKARLQWPERFWLLHSSRHCVLRSWDARADPHQHRYTYTHTHTQTQHTTHTYTGTPCTHTHTHTTKQSLLVRPGNPHWQTFPTLTTSVLCPDPTPKRAKGHGTLPWSCWLNSYAIFEGYYAIFSNLSHLHVYTNIGNQCKPHARS